MDSEPSPVKFTYMAASGPSADVTPRAQSTTAPKPSAVGVRAITSTRYS